MNDILLPALITLFGVIFNTLITLIISRRNNNIERDRLNLEIEKMKKDQETEILRIMATTNPKMMKEMMNIGLTIKREGLDK